MSVGGNDSLHCYTCKSHARAPPQHGLENPPACQCPNTLIPCLFHCPFENDTHPACTPKRALECRQGAYRFQKGSGKGRGLEYWDTGRLGDSPSRVAGGLWRGFYMYNSEENHFHQLTSKRSSAIQSHSVFNPI